MGEIVGAALVSHVPTIVLPEEVRREINNGADNTLHAGLHQLRAEKLEPLAADTVVVFDSHWFTTFEHIISAHSRRAGHYTSEELPRAMASVAYDLPGDPELAHLVASRADGRDDTWITAIDDPHLPIHYPTVNLLPFLQGDERWVSVGVCQTATADDFLLFGELLGEAIAESERRVVLLASGGLSHKFWPLRELRDHESSDLRDLHSPEARAADEQILRWMRDGDHRAIIDDLPSYRAYSPEGFFAHYLMMLGALGGSQCTARGTQFGEYESAAGTGQAHVWFDL